jgi:hypothetical protein
MYPPVFLFLVALAPCLLAGVFDLTPTAHDAWGVAGAWTYPVGDPYDLTRPESDGEAGFIVRRSIGRRSGHQGADLSNRAQGGRVRAAAAGIVVRTAVAGWNGGYGNHAVIAHRDAYGSLCYSVYAHLAPRSLQVSAGDVVTAGQPVGRVGRTGRASSPHLHFEVRVPNVPEERWENARVVDPLTWIQERLPITRSDSSWARPYLEWAERAGLLAETSEEDTRIRREVWWRMVSAAFRGPAEASAASRDSLGPLLVGAGLVVDDHAKRSPRGHVGWDEIARDLARARERGMRTGECASPADRIGADSDRELGPVGPAVELSDRTPGSPTIGRVCLLLARLAGAPEAATASRDEGRPEGASIPPGPRGARSARP